MVLGQPMIENSFNPVDLPPAILTGVTGKYRDEPVTLELRITEILWPGMEMLVWNTRLQLPGLTLDVSKEAFPYQVQELYRAFSQVRQGGPLPTAPVDLGPVEAQLFEPLFKAKHLLGVYGTTDTGGSPAKNRSSVQGPLEQSAMALVESSSNPFRLDFTFLVHMADPPDLDVFLDGLAAQVRALDDLLAGRNL